MKTPRLLWRRPNPRNRPGGEELRWRCDDCGYYLVTREQDDRLNQIFAIAAWCPCLPWDIRALRLGMLVRRKKSKAKGAIRVTGIDRSNERVFLEDDREARVDELEPA